MLRLLGIENSLINHINQYVNMFKGYIYKCTCTENLKSYIGLTTKTLEERKKEHIYSAFNPNDNTYKTHFHSALRKHGVENFIWEVLEETECSDLPALMVALKDLEKRYIKFYDSFENGYNLTPGGELTFRGEPKVINMYNESGELIDSGTIGYISATYNLDSSAVCKVCNRIYNFTGKLNGQRLVFRYQNDEFTSSDKETLSKLKK